METTQASLDHLTWDNPMGEARKDALRLDFDRKLKLEFHGTKVTSDAWRAMVVVCQNGVKKRILGVWSLLFGGFSGTACSICWNYLETEVKLRYY